mmetsp:Transcript_13132/g.28313  ORF Transcript_13132/g.28313 Transcript_13132/m.28313 type:complete len:298 (+) Transcript_13132:511-1404(+)
MGGEVYTNSKLGSPFVHRRVRPPPNLPRRLDGRVPGSAHQVLHVLLVRRLLSELLELQAEAHGQIANDADSRSHEVVANLLSSRCRISNLANEQQDVVDVGHEGVALMVSAQALQNTGVRLEDALAQLLQIINEVGVALVDLGAGSLVKHGHRYLQVLVEIPAHRKRDVAKATENRRLHVAVERRVLRVPQQQRHDFVAIRNDLSLQRAANIADDADSDGADLVFLRVAQAEAQEGAEVWHIFLELGLGRVGDGSDGHECFLVHRRVLRRENLEKELHHSVRERNGALSELLCDDLK